MARYASILSGIFLGMVVSFLGSLPLGTMNVTATQISIQTGIGVVLHSQGAPW
jgi:hypothetical protein